MYVYVQVYYVQVYKFQSTYNNEDPFYSLVLSAVFVTTSSLSSQSFFSSVFPVYIQVYNVFKRFVIKLYGIFLGT